MVVAGVVRSIVSINSVFVLYLHYLTVFLDVWLFRVISEVFKRI